MNDNHRKMSRWSAVEPTKPPLVKGGQGRSDEDVEGDAWGLLVLLVGVVIGGGCVVLAQMLWRML